MTGYAWEERRDDDVSLSVEIKGYNSRFLEIFVYLPPYLSSLEAGIRDYMASRCRRGKVEIGIRVKEHNGAVSVSVNREAARAYGEAVSVLAETLHIDEKPSLSLLLGLEGVLEIEKKRDDERYRKLIEPLLLAAADRFNAERIREGKHTQEDILSHIAVLESSVKTVASHGPALELSIRENLRARFTELLGDRIDESRIFAETAVLLMKYTISEELSRLSAHLAEFRAETERNPSPGKKLDFLCQEINREINTIGSKTPVLEVSRMVVEMKDALENIREQLRNVE
ncbi:MAG: YicC family protein [Spirochaetaceae bacterium]|jgi:uncharacterized protein (TIGR00255 family)|nr:YicC family protein [Spirochaetaceae bacterium]